MFISRQSKFLPIIRCSNFSESCFWLLWMKSQVNMIGWYLSGLLVNYKSNSIYNLTIWSMNVRKVNNLFRCLHLYQLISLISLQNLGVFIIRAVVHFFMLVIWMLLCSLVSYEVVLMLLLIQHSRLDLCRSRVKKAPWKKLFDLCKFVQYFH